MGGPTEWWTLNITESPNDAAECSLSRVLETGPHLLRYSLSAKACAGILRRAHRRGRVLPAQLHRPMYETAWPLLDEAERETLTPPRLT